MTLNEHIIIYQHALYCIHTVLSAITFSLCTGLRFDPKILKRIHYCEYVELQLNCIACTEAQHGIIFDQVTLIPFQLNFLHSMSIIVNILHLKLYRPGRELG